MDFGLVFHLCPEGNPVPTCPVKPLQESVPTLVLIILSQYYRWEIPQTKLIYLGLFFSDNF